MVERTDLNWLVLIKVCRSLVRTLQDQGASRPFGASTKIVITKELGLGTAAAVLVDASIVRALLVRR